MVVCMVLLSACGETTPIGGSSSDNSSSGKSETNNGSSSDASSDESSSNINPLLGTLSAQSVFSVENAVETEADKPYNCANLNNPIKGAADKEADELRATIMNAKNTNEAYEIKGKTYYISANGNDENDGLSKDKPFKTIDALDSIELEAGDAVLFERDSVFRLNRSLNCISGIVYGSYGSGNKPALYFSPKNYGDISLWTPTNKKNVWVAEFPYGEACSVVLGYGSEIGYRRAKGLQELDVNYEFYHNTDSGFVYMYCDLGNPGRIFSNIEIVPVGRIINVDDGAHDIVIDNLCLKYAGNLGINLGCVHDVTITNCEIAFTGGAEFAGGTTRYGNGIQFWQGGTDITVKYNWVYQTFDSAITWQGQTKSSGKAPTVYKNIHFDNNLLEYNNADYEFFDTEGSSIENYTMDNNIMRFTNLGWGSRQEDSGIRGIEGTIRGVTTEMIMKSISIKNNIIDTPARKAISWVSTEEQFRNTVLSGNRLYINGKYRFEENVIAGLYDGNGKGSATNQAELRSVFDSLCGVGAFETVWNN